MMMGLVLCPCRFVPAADGQSILARSEAAMENEWQEKRVAQQAQWAAEEKERKQKERKMREKTVDVSAATIDSSKQQIMCARQFPASLNPALGWAATITSTMSVWQAAPSEGSAGL